ncbi:hypothetical protein C7999DRAFT_43981 [Corynascus novoguineensis]|uniref:Uncharacterized protein n=1 Tax=Corynascus novoguineensis TaxID=1126955 RepID=A0AAN7CM67_9PEZI|nr:hypothetical protein C7999DRAFT_43981 [Corynascus novoguineensis]
MLQDLKGPPSRPPALLRLPPHIRRRIYLFLGMAPFIQFPYTYYLDGHKESRLYVSHRDPPPASNFAGFLLSCRALYDEVAVLLYSANRFVIHYPHHRSLEPLRALTPTSLAALTSLKIVLNESSCHYPTDSNNYPPSDCCDPVHGVQWCTEEHGTLHSHPLLESPPGTDPTSTRQAVQALLAEWHNTAAYLSSRVSAGRLDLWLVTWSRESRGYQICCPPCIMSEGGCPPHVHHGCRLSQCSPYVHEGLMYNRSHGCFCRRRHGAASSTCNCWAPPTSLFLVSRVLCRDAQFVFFTENHFTIRDFYVELPFENLRYDTSRNKADYPFERLAVSEFLRDVVPTYCLANLRFLELLFPIHVAPKYLDKDTLEREWCATLDWVRDKINPLALTIRCVMVHHHLANSASSAHRLLALTEEEETRVLRAHARILCPLENFSRDIGMAGFNVQIAHYASLKPDKKRYLLRQFKQMGRFPVERWEILPENVSEFRNSSDNVDPRDGTWQIWYAIPTY